MIGLIIQTNLHHSKVATDILALDMQRSRSQVVALVQEPYLGNRGVPSLIPRGLDRYHHSSGGRAAILGKGCSLLLCPEYTSRDVVTCQVTQGDKEIYLVSVYADIKVSHLPDELDCLLVEKCAGGSQLCPFKILLLSLLMTNSSAIPA